MYKFLLALLGVMGSVYTVPSLLVTNKSIYTMRIDDIILVGTAMLQNGQQISCAALCTVSHPLLSANSSWFSLLQGIVRTPIALQRTLGTAHYFQCSLSNDAVAKNDVTLIEDIWQTTKSFTMVEPLQANDIKSFQLIAIKALRGKYFQKKWKKFDCIFQDPVLLLKPSASHRAPIRLSFELQTARTENRSVVVIETFLEDMPGLKKGWLFGRYEGVVQVITRKVLQDSRDRHLRGLRQHPFGEPVD